MSAEGIRLIERLHKIYVKETGRTVPLDMGRQNEWGYLLVAIDNMDATPEEAVALVARRVKKLIAKGQLWESALDFRRFVGRTDEFQDNLAAALAERRKPKPSPALKAVEAFTGRKMEAPTQPAVSAGAVLERTKLADMLREWSKKNL